jgi:hypothetical protein
MSEERDLLPNLVDALEGDASDARELDAVARLLTDLSTLQEPPAGLFDAIATEAFGHARAAGRPRPLRSVGGTSMGPADGQPRSQPGLRRWSFVAVAAVVAVVAGIAGALVLGGSSEDPVEQQVELVALPGFEGAEGTALLVERGDDRQVEVDLAGVDLPEGSRLELWLLDPAVSQTISLGVLDEEGPFTVPADVDLSLTPILDVSVEPDDGDPAHSGVSVVRGEIDSV